MDNIIVIEHLPLHIKRSWGIPKRLAMHPVSNLTISPPPIRTPQLHRRPINPNRLQDIRVRSIPIALRWRKTSILTLGHNRGIKVSPLLLALRREPKGRRPVAHADVYCSLRDIRAFIRGVATERVVAFLAPQLAQAGRFGAEEATYAHRGRIGTVHDSFCETFGHGRGRIEWWT